MVKYTSVNIIPSNNLNLRFSTVQELAVLLSPFSTPTCQSHNTTVTSLPDTSKSQFHLPGAIHLAAHVVMTTHVIIICSRSSSCTNFSSTSPWYSRGPKYTSYFITVIWNNIILPFNTLKPELNPICYLLALLAHHFLHVSRIRVKSLTIRLLMSYTYIWSTYSWCF